MKVVIVGFDPGTRAGIAILDTFGRVIFLSSKTNAGIATFSKIITSHGKPLIVATDRKPVPKGVEKLAKSVGAKLFVPEDSMSVKEKEELVRRFNIKIKNDHERDALAAVVKAYKNYANLLRKIYISTSSLGLNEKYNEIVENIIFGRADNIDEAINLALSPKIAEKKIEKPTEKPVAAKKDTSRLEKDIEILKRFNQNLLKENAQLVEMLNKNRVSSNDGLKKQIDELRRYLDLAKNYRRMEIEKKIPLIEIEKIDINLLGKLDEYIDLADRVVFVKRPANLQELNEYKIGAAVVTQDVERSKLDFPVIMIKERDIKDSGGIKYIEKEFFDQTIKDARKEGLKEWVKEYRKRRI